MHRTKIKWFQSMRLAAWSFRCAFLLVASTLVLLGRGTVVPAAAAEPCQNLPASEFQVLVGKADSVDVARVMTGDITRASGLGDVISQHTMMLTGSNVVAWFDIAHRIIPERDGSVCDAPTLIRMAFGVKQRFALLGMPAADNDCARKAMLEHEAAHNGAVNDAIETFVADHTPDFSRMVIALKYTPSQNRATAELRWEEGLKMVLNSAKKDLLFELADTLTLVDSTSKIAALEGACGGLLRRLEHRDG